MAGIATTAKRDGDEYVINGAKTFISNGMSCDLVVVAARTENSDDPHRSLSLFVVEADTPGFIKSRRLEKMGMDSQDTAELAFDDCRVPTANLLGQEGAGFMMLMQKLQQERLCVAIMSQASAEKVLEDAIAYTQERKAFGRSISKFQNTQFTLAQCATEIEVGRAILGSSRRTARGREVSGQGVLDGQALADRDAGPRRRCVLAALRRLRLHARVSNQPGLHGCTRSTDLCGNQRNHEGHSSRSRWVCDGGL